MTLPDEPAVVFGSGAAMAAVPNGGADLIVTGPPYFPAELEPLLRAPRREQTRFSEVQAGVTAYALSLRPVFAECARVLRPGRPMCVQTKDLRYGGRLLSLTAIHRDVMESCGLYLVTRFVWLNSTPSPRKVASRATRERRAELRGGLRASEVEDILVVTGEAGIELGPRHEATDSEVSNAISPLWSLPGPGRRRHPYASPTALVRRLITFYSDPGDLVVDPFAGGGTTLRVARRLGRRAMGYEIDPQYAGAQLPLLQDPNGDHN
jgi:modification methylase